MNPPGPAESSTRDEHRVSVRAATDRDAEAIVQIYNHYVRVGGATFDTLPWTATFVVELIDHPKPDGWFVAIKNDGVVGWASVRRFSNRFGYRFSCETAIYLEPSAMGQGVGDLLQQRVEAHCRNCEIHHAMAKIIADNQRSIAFHRRYGYEMVGIQKEIGHMDGQWLDVAILQKIF